MAHPNLLEIPPGFNLAPIHPVDEWIPLTVGVLMRANSSPGEDPFILLRELPGARVYLGGHL